MYIKIENGQLFQYPYSISQLRSNLPDVSLPQNIPDSLLAKYGVFKVKQTVRPEIDYTQNLIEKEPQLIDGEWTQVFSVVPAPTEELLQRVLNLRAKEYPPMSDYLDGIVKGDQAQVDKYIADCLAVKAKYPKP